MPSHSKHISSDAPLQVLSINFEQMHIHFIDIVAVYILLFSLPTEVGHCVHPCKGDLVCKSDIEKVPYFNASIYLKNKSQIGKVDEIFAGLCIPYVCYACTDKCQVM